MTDHANYRAKAEAARYNDEATKNALLAIYDLIDERLPSPKPAVTMRLQGGILTPATLRKPDLPGEPGPTLHSLDDVAAEFGVALDEPDDLPGEPVEPGDLRAGDRVAFTWDDDTERIEGVVEPCRAEGALDAGGMHLVATYGKWAGCITDVRRLERAPREDEDLPGEPVDPGDLRAGDVVEFTWAGTGERITCTLVSDGGGDALRSDTPDSVRLTPNVVYRGKWAGGISDVRLIERAPREDEDRVVALAMDLYHASLGLPPASEIGSSAWDDFTRREWLDVARAAREHIEAGQMYAYRPVAAERDKAEAERDEWREVAARYADGRDKWQAKWRESDEARERAEAERAEAARHADRWCEQVHEMRDERDGWKVRCEKAEAALADERDRHDATITERDALRDERGEWKARHAALRADVETRWAFVDDNFLKDILHSILKGDRQRAEQEEDV